MKMQKPAHLLEGIGQGAKSLGNGIVSGLTGVFTQPYRGAQ